MKTKQETKRARIAVTSAKELQAKALAALSATPLRERVAGADFGDLTASELEVRLLDGACHPEDADDCLSDAAAILRGDKGPDAVAAFTATLRERMTRHQRPEVAAVAAPKVKRDAKAAKVVQTMMEETSMEFHALFDLSRNAGEPGNKLNVYTLRETVNLLAREIRAEMAKARDKLTGHDDQGEFNQAFIALSEAMACADGMAAEEGAEMPKQWQGRALHALTLDAARALERIELAFSGRATVGWLARSQEWCGK